MKGGEWEDIEWEDDEPEEGKLKGCKSKDTEPEGDEREEGKLKGGKSKDIESEDGEPKDGKLKDGKPKDIKSNDDEPNDGKLNALSNWNRDRQAGFSARVAEVRTGRRMFRTQKNYLGMGPRSIQVGTVDLPSPYWNSFSN